MSQDRADDAEADENGGVGDAMKKKLAYEEVLAIDVTRTCPLSLLSPVTLSPVTSVTFVS